MKILLDLQSCQSGSRLGGIGRYSLQLSKAIAREAGKHDVWIMLNNRLPDTIPQLRKEFSDIVPQTRILTFESITRANELHARDPFRTRSAEYIREKFIADLNPDVVFVTSLFEGLGDDVVTSVGKLPGRQRTAVTLYDLIPLAQKDRYLTDDITLSHYMRKLDSLKRADVLLAISEFSRDEGRQLLDYPQDRIVNMSSAIGDDFFREIEIPESERLALYHKLGIKNRFLMYTGSFDQRKNHKLLIEAFALVPASLRDGLQLVIVGNGWDGVYADLRKHAERFGLQPTDIIFAGHINDDTLLKLFNLCYLFVFPSLFEGFGLPILEAMSCGTPAIGSNRTSIPEVIGREDALFDPTSADSIASKIVEFLRDSSFRKSLREHATVQAKKFSWERSARIALAAFEDSVRQPMAVRVQPRRVADSGEYLNRRLALEKIAATEGVKNASDGTLNEIAAAIAVNEVIVGGVGSVAITSRMARPTERVGVVTTWNTKCGIATYSKFLMRAYPTSYHVFAPHTDAKIESDGSNVIRCWSIGDGDDLTDLEQSVLEQDITVLVIQFNYGFFRFSALSALIDRLDAQGVSVLAELHSTVDPPEHILPKKLAELATALNRCASVMVHSDKDVARLANIGIAANVVMVPHGVNRPTAAPVPYERTDHDFVIASYGFFLPHKGLHELIEAFSKISLGATKVKLLLVNAEYPAPESTALIAEARRIAANLSVSDRVTFVTGFLSDEESIGYLKKADLIIYPYQHTGESASGAVRLGLASEVPVAVTPLEIFGDVKNVTHALPGTSPDDLARGITSLAKHIIEGNAEIVRVRLNCAKWLDVHDYNNLTDYLESLILMGRAMRNGYGLDMHFSAKESCLSTIVGERSSKGIESRGREGVLLFGPYINLAPGRYRLYVRGSAESPVARDMLSLRLAYGGGSQELPYEHISVASNDPSVLFGVECYANSPVSGFEIQVISQGGCDVTISDVVVSTDRKIA